MSRDYDLYCPKCMGSNAREEAISVTLDDKTTKYQGQCQDCGYNYLKIKTTNYIDLEIKGTDNKSWKKAEKELLK